MREALSGDFVSLHRLSRRFEEAIEHAAEEMK